MAIKPWASIPPAGELIEIKTELFTKAPTSPNAPTRATTLPTDSAERKSYPVASGVLDYFPDALVAIAKVSWQGNNQHHPELPLHWDRSKSRDEADTAMRHFMQRGTRDIDGIRHTAKFAWRALALLQKEIESEANPIDSETQSKCPFELSGMGCSRPKGHDIEGAYWTPHEMVAR